MNLPRTLYSKLFSSKGFSNLNDKLLSFALAARGYNNYENGAASGEIFFIKSVLSKTNSNFVFVRRG